MACGAEGLHPDARGFGSHGDETRCVWLADSFAGVPRPDIANYKADKGLRLDRYASILGVPEAEVRANFERYGLLDDRVRFLPGWFEPRCPMPRLIASLY